MRLAPAWVSSVGRRRRPHQRYVWCSVCLLLLVAGVRCAGTTHTVFCWAERVFGTWSWRTITASNLAAKNIEQPLLHSSCCVRLLACLCLGQRQQAETLLHGLALNSSIKADTWGISQRRAEWFVKWAPEVAAAETVHVARFEEGLGRIMYVVGALELEHPFFGPLYRYMSLHPRNTVQRVLGNVRFFLQYLADQISETRHYRCAVELHASLLAPRVDAQASSNRTGIGGSDGNIDVSLSSRFSSEIRQEEWLWVCATGRKSALIKATLEA